MANSWQLKAIISAADKLSPTIKQIQRNFRGLHKTAIDVTHATRGLLSSTALIAAPVIAGAMVAARSMTNTAAAFERFETILETIEGSSDKAKSAMQWINQFATKTPYELAEVTEAFVKLRAYGIDPIANQSLATLGDTAAAMGKPLMQVVEAMADAMTGENERLKEFGIRAAKVGQWLVYEYSLAGKTMKARAKANSREHIQATLQAIWNKKYAGSMDKLSRTWSGMTSNLADQWSRFSQMVMNSGAFAWMKGKLSGILAQLDVLSNNGTLQQWANEIGGALKNLFVAITGKETASAQSVLEHIKNSLVALIHTATTFVQHIQSLKNQVGGWGNLLIGGFILANASLMTSLITLAGAVFRFGRILVSTALGCTSAIAGIRSFILTIGASASAALIKIVRYGLGAGHALLLLGRALMLTPIGMVLTLATATYLLYKNWDTVKKTVSHFFSQFPYWLGYAIGSICAGFQKIKNIISTVMQSALEAIKGWAINLCQSVLNTIDYIVGAFKILPQKIGQAIKGLGQVLKNIWLEPQAAVSQFVNSTIAKIKTLVDLVKKIGTAISQIFNNTISHNLKELVRGFDQGKGTPISASNTLLNQPAVTQYLSPRQQLTGEMTVHFEGAPPGLRVSPGRTNQPGMTFNPDVGYRVPYGSTP